MATDSPETPSLQLVLTFEAAPPVAVLPSPRLLLVASEGEPTRGRVLLHAEDGSPIHVTSTTHDLPLDLTVHTEPVSEPEPVAGGRTAQPGDLWVELALPAQSHALRQRGELTIHTDDPDVPVIEIAVSVSVQSLIEVQPERVNLRLSDSPGRGGTVNVRLTHVSQRPFGMTGVEVSRPDLITATLVTQGDRASHVLGLALAQGLTADALAEPVTATVRVHTSEPAKPVVEIPVTVTRRHRQQRVPVRPPVTPSPEAGQGR